MLCYLGSLGYHGDRVSMVTPGVLHFADKKCIHLKIKCSDRALAGMDGCV